MILFWISFKEKVPVRILESFQIPKYLLTLNFEFFDGLVSAERQIPCCPAQLAHLLSEFYAWTFCPLEYSLEGFDGNFKVFWTSQTQI